MMSLFQRIPEEEKQRVRSEVEECIRECDEAYNRRDVEGVMKFYTKDYISIDRRGKRGHYSQLHPNFVEVFADLPEFTSSTEITHFSYNGRQVFLVTKSCTRLIKRDPRNSLLYEYVVTTMLEQTAVKVDGIWKVRKSRCLLENTTAEYLELARQYPPDSTPHEP